MATRLINRQNYDEIQEFLRYQERTRQNDALTVELYRNHLMFLLKWAWDRELRGAAGIRPGFVEYLVGAKTRKGKPLAASTFTKVCTVARAFFAYQREHHRNAYSRVSVDWVEGLHPPRLRSEQAVKKQRDLYTVEEAVKLATWPTKELRLQRAQAGAAFLFLSGMRIGAFMTLPIACVDLEHLKVKQFPTLGVRTKNRKAAETTILDVAELLEVVRKWDARVRKELGAESCWCPSLEKPGCERLLAGGPDPDTETRGASFRGDLEELCRLAGVRFLSPHKFRHGHAVYALKRAKDMKDWKAVSQNLMHHDTGITDAIYGELVEDDQHEAMLEIGRREEGKAGEGIDLDALAEKIARKMKSHRGDAENAEK